MTTQEIVALLEATFQGVRKDGLTQLATVIGIQCDTKEEVTAAVGRLTADKVKQFVADWRKEADAEIGRATSTYEANLRKKYNLVEKQEPATTKQPMGLWQKALVMAVVMAITFVASYLFWRRKQHT